MNKFNLAWQLTRMKARDIKTVPEKIAFVMNFLNKHPNIHNYARVFNWLKMTSLGYSARGEFEKMLDYLESRRPDYGSSVDYDLEFDEVSTAELKKLLKDLSKRKYDFQFGSTPKAHTEFVEQLQKELEKRNADVEG